MFAVRVAHASTGIAMPRLSLYSSTSAVMYRARTCKSPTRPAVVRPMLSSSRYTFFVRLWAISVPAVARRSAARTTPSLQTRPSVVVPVSTSLKQLPFVHSRSKGCQKDNRSIRPALFKNCCFYLETEIKRDSVARALSDCGAATDWTGANRMTWTRSHSEVSPPDADDHYHDDHDGDSDVEVHLPLAFLLAAETQTRDIVRHVGPRPPKMPSRNKGFVIRETTAPHSTGHAALGRPDGTGPHTRFFPSGARRSRRSRRP